MTSGVTEPPKSITAAAHKARRNYLPLMIVIQPKYIVQSMMIMNMKPVYSLVKNITIAIFKVNEQTYTSHALL